MKNKTIIIVLAIVIVALGLMSIGSFTAPQGANVISTAPGSSGGPVVSGSLSAEEGSFDFGTISMAAGKVAHTFKVKNNGANPITIQRVSTSCMCTSAFLSLAGDKLGPFGMEGMGYIPEINKIFAPGAEADVEVVFDPAAHGPAGVGKINRVVHVETKEGGMLEFKIAANVAP